MRLGATLVALALTEALAASPVDAQVELHLFGKPYFSGAMTLSVTAAASPGAPVLLAYGLDPLPLDPPAFNKLMDNEIVVNARIASAIGMKVN